MTQGDQIASALKTRAHTYLEMSLLCVCACPWKRALEWLTQPRAKGWSLRKGKRWMGGREYLTTWQIVRAPNVGAKLETTAAPN